MLLYSHSYWALFIFGSRCYPGFSAHTSPGLCFKFSYASMIYITSVEISSNFRTPEIIGNITPLDKNVYLL